MVDPQVALVSRGGGLLGECTECWTLSVGRQNRRAKHNTVNSCLV